MSGAKGHPGSATATYGDAPGYDAYMGRWSAALAPPFVRFACLSNPKSVLDIGCGTGNLLAAVCVEFPEAGLVGIDPSHALLDRTRARADLAGVELVEGADLSVFKGATFDACLSLLVLQEFSDLPEVLRQMRRVTRSGGVVAACQWDFAAMPVIAALVEAIASVDAATGARLAVRAPGLIADEGELAREWSLAGFAGVSTTRIRVVQEYPDFDAVWRPLLAGSTPSTLALARLPAVQQASVREHMLSRLVLPAEAPIRLMAEALAVRGEA